MRNDAIASLLVVAIVASAGTGYLVGITSSHVATTTEIKTNVGLLSQCGFTISCSAANPYGLLLTLSINYTLVKSNGSLTLIVSEFNPTSHYVNLSRSNNWYLDSLPTFWDGTCYHNYPPYGIAVFRGYYTLQNVSAASDVLRPSFYPPCLSDIRGNVTGFKLPPASSQIQIVYNGKTPYSLYPYVIPSIQICAVDSDALGVNSLRSSQPAVYTMAVGDEWGTLVLLHFTVV